MIGIAVNSLCIILAAESFGEPSPSWSKNLFFGGSLSNTVFFFFSSKFSKIFNALSDSKRFNIFAIDSIDKIINISACIDSFNSIKISGSRLKPSNSISFNLLSGSKFSIISAESDGWSSFKVLFKKFASFSLIFLVKKLKIMIQIF